MDKGGVTPMLVTAWPKMEIALPLIMPFIKKIYVFLFLLYFVLFWLNLQSIDASISSSTMVFSHTARLHNVWLSGKY